MSKSTEVNQKCKNCGGEMIFNPSQNGLVCVGCGSFEPVDGAMTTEKSFETLINNAPTWQKDTAVIRCEHCGAKSVVSKSDLVAKCDYCGAATMVRTDELPGLRPDTIVPFDWNRTDACQQVNNWLSKRLFVPSDFKQQLRERQLNGIYYPAFTFDAHVITRFSGVLVQTSTSTIVVDGKQTVQTQTFRRGINNVDTHTFDDFLVVANEDITPKVMAHLQPFDTNHGQAFKQSYLAGFTVCQSSIEAKECWREAKKLMEAVIRNKIKAKYTNGNTTIENLQLDLSFSNITYKYVLLPVYVGHIEYHGNKYPLYMNGQTGKIYGKTPKSFWKILLTCAGLGLAAFGLGIVLAMFL